MYSMKAHCSRKILFSNCSLAAMKIEETDDIDDRLLEKLRQFALSPSPLHRERINQRTPQWDVAIGQLLEPPVTGLAWTKLLAT
jgi:hypothetical protein